MTKSTNQLPENYIQQLLETYADGLEKHKDDNKALLVELLKASDKLGKRIDSFKDYESLQTSVAEMETKGDFSGLQKLGLKYLKAFIAKEYPQYGGQWLAKKQEAEEADLAKKHNEEKQGLTKLFPLSEESEIKDQVSYIENLIATNELAPESVDQLNNIKELYTKHKSTIDLSKRLTIKNNLVCIDGYTLPTGIKPQIYKDMKKNPEGLTYPNYAKVLLTFAADLTETTFSFPSNRDKLQKGKIDGEAFKKEINTDNNNAIIKTLYDIVGFNSVIPVGLDKDGCVIYAGVRSDYCCFCFFNRNSSVLNSCLVSAV